MAGTLCTLSHFVGGLQEQDGDNEADTDEEEYDDGSDEDGSGSGGGGGRRFRNPKKYMENQLKIKGSGTSCILYSMCGGNATQLCLIVGACEGGLSWL